MSSKDKMKEMREKSQERRLEAAEEFSDLLNEKLGEKVKVVAVWGSVSKGEHEYDSDIDTLVILDDTQRETEVAEDAKMKITGFKQVRRDWSPIAKRTQKEVLRKVLENKVDEAYEVAQNNIEALKNGEVPIEDLKIYTTLTKPPEEYDSTSPHVEAAKKAKSRGKEIPEESTITYVITATGSSISDQAEILEYAESYDSDYYIENQVIPAVLRVLKVFGYTEGQLKGKGRQSGLGRFG